MDLGHDLSQAMANDANYAGELSFARRRYTRDLQGADIVVVGIPFDSGTCNRPGARFGPRAIREQTTVVGAYPWGIWPWTFNVFERHEVIDYSDIAVAPGYPQRLVDAVTVQVGRIIDAGCSVLALGGDHMVAHPLLAAHAARYGPLSLIHFDAHSDTWGMGDDLNHGTSFYRAAEDGTVDPSRSIQVGMRTPNPETHGYEVVDVAQLLDRDLVDTVAQIRRRVGTSPTYVSFDIDFLDPAYAPGTGTPVVGGPTTRHARQLLHGLAGLNVVGADIVEVAPPYDSAGITALAAATLAFDLLNLISLARASEH